ncbi:PP2C family serine/threonine-protein phosphatase [Streptomyces morookaense]|uniref:PP2C family serine/threonine-protein phosphatase n=1 Tax=Streptomyces morookaense TaxID=1970 RepID=UPI00280B14D0|nr:PP2C family serine/threonine-protein phosphatase [Streptomyces morookaense]
MSVPHWRIFRESVQGPGKAGNQDWYDAEGTAEGNLVLAVADGHGSAVHSRSGLGARFAVDIFMRCAREFAARAGETPGNLRQLRHDACRRVPREVVRDWQDEVHRHLKDHPLAGVTRGDELLPYGTTLLGAVCVPGLVVAWQLGDGDLMLVEADGTISAPLAPSEPELGDETESLCSRQAWDLMRVHWAPVSDPGRLPRLLMLSTDGLSKSFAAQDGFVRFVREVSERLAAEGPEAIGAALPGWLARASTYSGDDTTVAAVWRRPDDPDPSEDGSQDRETEND